MRVSERTGVRGQMSGRRAQGAGRGGQVPSGRRCRVREDTTCAPSPVPCALLYNTKYMTTLMRTPPPLPSGPTAPPSARRILLINPFYPKDTHASFGKHVLTPSLALTSIAGATPPEWDVEYWDENLLQGSIPANPFPAVVGITVHLTFAQRAFAIADWFRARGAVVIL